MNHRILVVDDEKDLVNLVRYNLEKAGFTVVSAYDGLSVLSMVWKYKPELIILDLMLPDRSGYDICRDLKTDPGTRDIPIIMLTARSSEYNRVTGFECGVEDYVVKPFSPKELVLRVKALHGRTAGTRVRQQQASRMIHIGKIRIFPDEYRVMVDEQEVPLTQTEFKILMTLAEQPNRVKTREQILTGVWQEEAETVMDRTVDAQVKRLRAKLGEARDMVETVRGLGYRLSAPATSASQAPPFSEKTNDGTAVQAVISPQVAQV
jgi:two-component system phosphate regulon response regulator PhoB